MSEQMRLDAAAREKVDKFLEKHTTAPLTPDNEAGILEAVALDTAIEYDAGKYLVVQMGHHAYDAMKAWLKQRKQKGE